jgi:hypothetical protein
VKSVEGRIKLQSRESGVIEKYISLNVKEEGMPPQIQLRSPIVWAQTQVDVYIDARIAMPTVAEGIKNLIADFDEPVLTLYDLKIVLFAPDDETLTEIPMSFVDAYTIYLKKKS